MASVRLSQEMRSRILSRAMDAFEVANPKWKPSNDFQSKLKAAVTESTFQKVAKQICDIISENSVSGLGLEKMGPEDYRFTSLTIKRPATDQEKTDRRTQWNEDYMELTVDFDTPISLWNKPGHYSSYNCELWVNDLDNEYRTEILEYVNEAHTSNFDRADAEKQYREQITALLQNCNTLKQLLETWPAAENLVDQEAISKMHEKVTRVSAAKQRRESVNFDADAANQMVLTAKLVGG